MNRFNRFAGRQFARSGWLNSVGSRANRPTGLTGQQSQRAQPANLPYNQDRTRRCLQHPVSAAA